MKMEIRFAGGRGPFFVGPENVFVGPSGRVSCANSR